MWSILTRKQPMSSPRESTSELSKQYKKLFSDGILTEAPEGMDVALGIGDEHHARKNRFIFNMSININVNNSTYKKAAHEAECEYSRHNNFHTEMSNEYTKGTLSQYKIDKLNNTDGWTWDINQLF
jgi:hypothetical protein